MVSKPGPPLVEIAIILAAIALLFIVFTLWWFFGYSYVFAEQGTVFTTAASTTTTMLAL